MIGKLFPILLALIGLGAGVGAGLALRPEPKLVTMDNPCGEVSDVSNHTADHFDEAEDAEKKFDYTPAPELP